MGIQSPYIPSPSISRRTFLAQAAAVGMVGTVGVAGVPRRSSAAASARTRPASGITFGFSTYGLKTLSTEQAIATIADIGFDSVEIAVLADWDADPLKLGANAGRRSAGCWPIAACVSRR